MKVIYGGNASGKTTKLIKERAKTGGYIICRDQREVHRVAEQAKKLNLEIPFPMTFEELINKRYCGKNIPNFCIDNAAMLLRSFTQVPINMISITKEKKMLSWFKSQSPAL